MKCILFSRVSTIYQDMDEQIEELKKEAGRLGYDDYVLIDKVESAIKLDEDERQGIIRLKDLIEKDRSIDCVICWEISRISRRPKVLYSVRDYLLEKGIQLIIMKPYMRLLEDGKLSQTANIMFSLFSSISESEMMIKKERFDRARKQMKKEGRLPTAFPLFGYDRLKDGYVQINEEKGKIVKEIFDRYEKGESCGLIAQDLVYRNIWTTKRYESIIVNVNAILNEKRYYGTNIYPAIISKEQFDKCREICKTHRQFRHKTTSTKYIYICNGLMRTKSGRSMCGSKSNSRYVVANTMYGRISIRMEIIDNLALEVVNEVVGISNIEDVEKERIELQEKKIMNEKIIEGIDQRIEEIKEENERINGRIIKGRLNEDKGDQMIDQNMKEIYKMADKKENILYNNYNIDNRLIFLSDPLLQHDDLELNTDQQKYDATHKYIDQIIIDNTGFGKYNIEIKTYIGKTFKYNVISYDAKRRWIKRIK